MPDSLPLANTHCAGSMRNGWCTSWTPSPTCYRAAQQKVRKLIWDFYADLKVYQTKPDKHRRLALRARFDRIFRRRTGFATLDRLWHGYMPTRPRYDGAGAA